MSVKAYISSRHGWAESTKFSASKNLAKLLALNLNPSDLVKHLEIEGYKPYTIKQYLIIMQGYEKFLGRSTTADYLKEHGYKFRNAYKSKTRRIGRVEFKEGLKQARRKPHWQNFLILTGKGGLRKSEAFSVKWSDFVEPNRLRVIGKGNKERFIPINQWELEKIDNEFLVPKFDERHMMKRLFGSFSAHDLRAMFVTESVNSGTLNLSEAAYVVGHSSVLTTNRYVRTDFNEIAKKLGVK